MIIYRFFVRMKSYLELQAFSHVRVELLWGKGKGRMEASKNFWARAQKGTVLRQAILLTAVIMHTGNPRPTEQKSVVQDQPKS